MKRLWTIVGVADVALSLQWYQTLLGLQETAAAHEDFAQVCDTDGTVLVSLHQWGTEDHPTLTSPGLGDPSSGLILFFRVDDFDDALMRVGALASAFAEEPNVNPNTGTREFALRDPDGYYVMISEA